MNTEASPSPQNTNTETNTEPAAVVAPKPKIGRWVLVIVIIALLAGAYWLTTRSQEPIETPADNTLVETTDPASEQLKSVSSDNSPSTISQEINDTNLEDVTAELDTIQAETVGL